MRILSVFTRNASEVQPPSQEDIDRMGALIAEMRGKGVLVDTGGRMPDMLEFTVARKNGEVSVIDGPYAESKEVVGGYALLEVAGREDAIAWSKRFLDLVGDASCHLHEVSCG